MPGIADRPYRIGSVVVTTICGEGSSFDRAHHGAAMTGMNAATRISPAMIVNGFAAMIDLGSLRMWAKARLTQIQAALRSLKSPLP